ncbi:MAG: HAMP domain-containing histidine kinase [Candidatus Melainabacteria bacterium]|nr:HAMP domain-containing histidine kinase [Candidatus Melainabacteria bacterium]
MSAFNTQKAWKGVDLNENPELRPAMEKGRQLREDFLQLYEQGIAALQGGQKAIENWANRVGMLTAYQMYTNQRQLARLIIEIERKATEQQPEELQNIRSTLILSLLTGLVVSAMLSLGLVFLFTRDIVKRLTAIASKAHLLAAGRELPSRIEGADEIAELDAIISDAGRTLNQVRAREAIVLDKAADVLCSIDSNMRFNNVGEACRKVWQYEPDELLGLSFLTLLTDDTIERTRAAFLRTEEGSGVSTEGRVENVVKCRGGAQKNFIWTVKWAHEKREYFCVVHDVSELRAVEKLKQLFLSVASHDLRAPLSAVSINVSLLTEGKKGNLSEGAIKELNRVQTSANRLTELVGELLELEKLEAGKLNLDLSAVSASDICEAAKELLIGLAQKNSVTIRGPIGEALIHAEEKRMVQMIANLLSNAIKFSPKEGTVTISIVSADNLAEIRIADQGPGIAPEERLLIFDKFRQSRTADGIAAKGTGLGLAIVRALAESHGGQVGIESEVGQGSTFYVRIPLYLKPEEESL